MASGTQQGTLGLLIQKSVLARNQTQERRDLMVPPLLCYLFTLGFAKRNLRIKPANEIKDD